MWKERGCIEYIFSGNGIDPDVRKCSDSGRILTWIYFIPRTAVAARILNWKRNRVFPDYCFICIAGNAVLV